MRSWTAAVAIATGAALSSGAWSQGGPPSPSATQAQQQAPTGHRQPKASDLPADPGTTSSDEAMKQMDRELDKKLKSICRGC